MTKLIGISLCASVVVLIGILAALPLLVTAATLCACGALLFALLSYFDQVGA